MPSTDPKIRLSWVHDRESGLLGTLMYTRSDFDEARDLIAIGKAQTEPLVTALYPLERLSEAMNELVTHPENRVKTLITIQT